VFSTDRFVMFGNIVFEGADLGSGVILTLFDVIVKQTVSTHMV